MRLLLYPVAAALCWMGICALVPSHRHSRPVQSASTPPMHRTTATAMEAAQAFGSR